MKCVLISQIDCFYILKVRPKVQVNFDKIALGLWSHSVWSNSYSLLQSHNLRSFVGVRKTPLWKISHFLHRYMMEAIACWSRKGYQIYDLLTLAALIVGLQEPKRSGADVRGSGKHCQPARQLGISGGWAQHGVKRAIWTLNRGADRLPRDNNYSALSLFLVETSKIYQHVCCKYVSTNEEWGAPFCLLCNCLYSTWNFLAA